MVMQPQVPVTLTHMGSKVDAVKAYDCKALELFGEYMYLNFGGHCE